MDTTCIDARLALTAAATRTAAMIRSLDDMERAIPRSEWTVGDAASHLILALRAYTDSVNQDGGEWRQVARLLPPFSGTSDRIAAVNRVLIPAEPKRTAGEAAAAIADGVAAFLAATGSLAPDHAISTPWYREGDTLAVAESTCLLLGEQVVHGYDLAQAAGRKWPIARSDALLILDAVHAMMPRVADRDAIGNLSATFRMHVGASGGVVVRCAGGAIHVEPPSGQRIDCHIAADPVAYLMIGYGRISHWRAIGRAKLITWGRKPWLGFRFPRLMTHP